MRRYKHSVPSFSWFVLATVVFALGTARCTRAAPSGSSQAGGSKHDEQDATCGARLYRLVQEYSDLGFHRTGTPVDARTVAWFAEQLKSRGGQVEQQPFTFDRFEGSSTVTIDGHEVSSMPLYYEGTGHVESDAPFVAAVEAMASHRPSKELAQAIEAAQASGASVAVLATKNSRGLLETPNRTPRLGSGLPVVLVAGSSADALQSGKVRVRYSGRIVQGQSANVIATFGDTARKPIVLATPLSGWFTCAAERGTGIAVALALAERLARKHAVVVVGSPGHEILPHVGLEAFLERNTLDPALVIHLGANVALGIEDPRTGEIRLAPGIENGRELPAAGRALFVRMSPTAFEAIRPAVARADLHAVLNPPGWHGEGALWAEAVNAPLMSFVGIGPQFHTPADLPPTLPVRPCSRPCTRRLGRPSKLFLRRSEARGNSKPKHAS